MSTVYQTASRRQGERFRYWSNLMCRTFAPAHGHVDGGEDFNARFTVSELGPTTVCTISAPKQFWERTRHHVRRAPRDEFIFTQLLSGGGVLRQDGHELVMRPGTMSIYDVSRPYSYDVGGDVLFVKLPRARLLEQLGQAPQACATPVQADAIVAGWASGVIRQAADLNAICSSRSASMIGTSVLSAVASLLVECPDERETAGIEACTQSLLTRVCNHIKAHLGDPNLTLNSIARAQGVSERSLNRLFAVLGTTPMRWVLQQRLAFSRRALEHDRGARVTDVAFAYGFNDSSHFSRVFKKTFAVSPQRVAADARAKNRSEQQ